MSKKIEKKEIHKNNVHIENSFVFGKANYTLMLIGLGLLILGFALMYGDENDIFSTRRITIAPIVVISGFVVEVFAIFRKTKD